MFISLPLTECGRGVLQRCEPLLLLSLRSSLEQFLSSVGAMGSREGDQLLFASSAQAEHPDCITKSRYIEKVKQEKKH